MSEANVLTSENSAAFYAKELNLDTAPIVADEKSEPVVEENTEIETENEPEKEIKEVGKDNKSDKLNKRFSELTKQREQALELAQTERQAREQAEQRARDLENKLNPPKVDNPVGQEPQPSQFTDAFEYAKALSQWSAENALAQRDKQEAEKRANDARELVVKTWTERQNAIKTEILDYEDVISNSAIMVSDQIRDSIIESDVGPKVLYYLATHPDEAENLKSLSVGAALRALGKIEAKLEQTTTPTTSKPAAEVSKAPAPITAIKNASGSADVPVDSKGEFVGTYEQWKTLRRSGKI